MAEGQVRLDLQVGLDTAYLQGQLATIGTRLAGQGLTLPVAFNRQDIATKTRALRRLVAGKDIDIRIESNTLEALTAKVKKFEERLKRLQDENIQLDISAGAVKSLSRRDASKVRNDLRASILGDEKKIYVPVSIKPSITRQDVRDFQNAVRSKLSGISVSVKANLETQAIRGGAKSRAEIDADVRRGLDAISEMGAARMRGGGQAGGVTEAARRESLRSSIENMTVAQLRQVAKQLEVGGVSGLRKASLIEKIVSDAAVEMIKKYLDPQAVMRNPNRGPLNQVLDTFARGLFRMLGMDPAAMREAERAKRALPPINWPAEVPSRRIPIGPSSTGRLLEGRAATAFPMIGGAVPAGLLPSISQRTAASQRISAIISGLSGGPSAGGDGGALVDTKRIYAALQKRLEDALRRSFTVIEVDVRESSAGIKDAMRAFSYLAQALRDAESRAKSARIDAAVDSLMKRIADSVKIAEARMRIIPAQVSNLGAPTQRMLQGQRIAGLLPPATGMSVEDRIARAYLRSGAREMSVMAEGGQRMLPPAIGRAPSPYSFARETPPIQQPSRSGGMIAGISGQIGRLGLPGSGVIRELASEFGEATKQVLLFGTAYKALAFTTSFPAQVGEAVSALQSFNNTLKAISPTAIEARASNQFILDIVSKYNIPLQSARDGFTKLYASMAPAGFKGDEVRQLFTGISQAAAAFSMSADKVDRVNYAFAQMASKGQVMSEELKGQLGDVLPGAMAIFAEAAGLKGPDAIQKFSKALEDGAYKGEAMKALLINVGAVMRKEFGPGAEGAARTFQGAINRMQNSMKLLYESFEPVAVSFLNAIVVPIGDGIKQLTDGINTFFGKTRAQTAGGFAIAQELERLKPALEGIRANIANLLPVLQSFGSVFLELSKILLQIAGNPVVGYLVKIYAIVLPLNAALGVMRTLWAANALQLLVFNARVALGTSTLTAFRGMMAATGATAKQTATAIRGAGLTLRTFFATTGVGLVVVGISMLIERFLSMNQALEDTRNKAVGAAQAIRSMTAVEARAEEQRATRAIRLIETLKTRKPSYAGSENISLSESEAALLEGLGIPVGKGLGGGRFMGPNQRQSLEAYRQRLETVNMAESQARQREVQFQEREAQKPAELQTIPEAAADPEKAKKDADKAAEEERRRREQLASQEQQRILALADMRNQLDQIGFDKYKALNEDALNFARRMIDAEFDYKEARANRFGKMQLDIARRVGEQQQNIDEALLKYRMGILEGQAKAAAAQAKAAAAEQADALMPASTAGGGGGFRGGASTGWTRDRDAEQSGYDVVLPGGVGAPVPAPVELRNIKTGFQGSGRGSSGRGYGNWITGEFTGVDGKSYELLLGHFDKVNVSPGMTVPKGGMLGTQGETGRTFGTHVTTHVNALNGGDPWRALKDEVVKPWISGWSGGASPVSGTAFATEKRGEAAKRDAQIAQQQAAADAEINSQRLLNSLREAEANTKTIIAQAMDRVLPLEEQRLDNMLAETRLSAQLAGLSDAQVETLMRQKEATMGVEATTAGFRDSIAMLKEAQLGLDKQLKDGTMSQDAYSKATKINNGMIQELEKSIADANIQLPLFNKELERTAAMEELARPFVALATAIRDAKQSLADMANPLFQTISIAEGVGNAFGETFRGLISGASSTREALAGFFQSLSDMFADMVAKMLAEWARLQIMQIFSPKSGASGLLGFDLASSGVSLLSSGLGAASSGIGFNPLALSGVQLFAKGGIVTGPTMGLVGEGRFNEAVVPLPDGKSIPVSLNGGASGGTSVVVNVDAKGTNVQGDDTMSKQLGTAISSAVQAELIKQQRPGGLLSTPRR